jgi:Ankyrin repeats (3 copies)
MSSITTIRPCSRFTTYCDSSIAQSTIYRIDYSTTPHKFKQWCISLKQQQHYSLEHGDDFGSHALYQAANHRNKKLAAALCKEGGSQLFELGNEQGLTALHAACKMGDYKIACLFLYSGSPINITTTKQHYLLPVGATCLDIAIKSHNISLIILLKLHGGVSRLPVAKQDEEALELANLLIAMQNKRLKSKLDEAFAFPKALCEIIISYALTPKCIKNGL